MTRLDASDINAIDNMVIKHVRDHSIHMKLADGVGTFCSIVHGIWLEGQDHDLTSNTVVVITLTFVFTQIVLINQCLSFCSQVMQVHHNRGGQKHISLKCWTSWGDPAGFVNAHADRALGGCKSPIDQVVCLILVGWVGCAKRCFDNIMNSFQNCV